MAISDILGTCTTPCSGHWQDGGCKVHADICGGELLTTAPAKREESINRLSIVLEVC